MPTYGTRLIEDGGNNPVCIIMTSDRESAARSAVANAMQEQDNGLYIGIVEVWDHEDADEPFTRYGWEVALDVPEDWDWDDEVPNIDVVIAKQG